MKKMFLLICVFIWISIIHVQAQALSGKEIYAGNCKACHSIGGGDIVGPDLAGVTERRDEEWIKNFVINSQKMVAEGDETAVALFNKYNKLPMPSHKFSGEELDGLIGYLEEAGKEVASAVEKEKTVTEEKPEKAELTASVAAGMSWHIKALLALMGVVSVILIVTSGYLYRVLKS